MTEMGNVLITGGSGFIGTNLIDYMELFTIAKIRNLDILPPVKGSHGIYWKECDILNQEKLRSQFSDFEPSYVIHLAARTDLDEHKSLEGYKVNIAGTENVLKAVNHTESVQRVIVTSSMLVNSLGKAVSCCEDYSPPNLYGRSKLLAETITEQFGLQKEWLIIRPTTIWGPWNFVHVDGFFRVLRRGIYVQPGGQAIFKSYGYVGNVAHQIVSLLNAPANKVHKKTFYVADPPINLRLWANEMSIALCGKKLRSAPMLIFKLIAYCGDMLGFLNVKFPLTSYRLANMTVENVVNIQETLDVTGPSPYSLSDGIQATVEWLRLYESSC